MRWLHFFTSLKCKRRKNLNERRMLIRWYSPRAFVNFAYAEFHSCSVFFAFKPIPLRWVGLPFTLASIKNKTHGTQSMGFKVIHQPKSRSVLIPCNSVANAYAFAWSYFRGKCFCFCLRYPQNWTIPNLHINQNRRNGRNVLFFLLAPSFYLIIFVDVVLCIIWCLLCTDNPLDS